MLYEPNLVEQEIYSTETDVDFNPVIGKSYGTQVSAITIDRNAKTPLVASFSVYFNEQAIRTGRRTATNHRLASFVTEPARESDSRGHQPRLVTLSNPESPIEQLKSESKALGVQTVQKLSEKSEDIHNWQNLVTLVEMNEKKTLVGVTNQFDANDREVETLVIGIKPSSGHTSRIRQQRPLDCNSQRVASEDGGSVEDRFRNSDQI